MKYEVRSTKLEVRTSKYENAVSFKDRYDPQIIAYCLLLVYNSHLLNRRENIQVWRRNESLRLYKSPVQTILFLYSLPLIFFLPHV
jgi:hypothetical protein